jgi:hypothetical protein
MDRTQVKCGIPFISASALISALRTSSENAKSSLEHLSEVHLLQMLTGILHERLCFSDPRAELADKLGSF